MALFWPEEAKLISELAEKDAINYGLFKLAYDASLDKFLDEYVMSKFHLVLYDIEGACVNIKAGSKGIFLEIWEEQLLRMYTNWAEQRGCRGRLFEKCCGKNCGCSNCSYLLKIKQAFAIPKWQTRPAYVEATVVGPAFCIQLIIRTGAHMFVSYLLLIKILREIICSYESEKEKNEVKLLSENKHVKYLYIPYIDSVVVVTCNPVSKWKGPPKFKPKYTKDEAMQDARDLYKECLTKYRYKCCLWLFILVVQIGAQG
ncbi:hypothetical protein Q3G72_031270 [Acer saccharum]|nr:hypothetical protein Q3G72_031270 [Acer saccharum]